MTFRVTVANAVWKTTRKLNTETAALSIFSVISRERRVYATIYPALISCFIKKKRRKKVRRLIIVHAGG